MNKTNQKLEKYVLLTISICFILWSTVFIYKSSFIAIDGNRYFCLFDDAMISMRYAWNLSHGSGLVWNQGEYIQGYSNFLLTLIMSLVTLIFDKSSSVLIIQALNVVIMLAIAYVNMKISDYAIPQELLQHHTFIRILSFLGILFYYPLVYWSLMGMETGLLTLLLLLSILFAFIYINNKTVPSLYLVAGFLGLAHLTRNDSIIFASLIWMYIAYKILLFKSKINYKGFTQLSKPFIFYALFIVGQLSFQYSYYGEMLPNTYTLKLTGMPLYARIVNGIGFTIPFITSISFIITLAIVGITLYSKKSNYLLLSFILSAISYQIFIGGDAWNYWRLTSPSMPLLIILFIIALDIVVIKVSKTGTFRIKIRVILLMLIGLALANSKFLREIMFLNTTPQASANHYNVNTAITLDQLITKDSTIGVYWAGSIPYFSGRKAVDFLGKSDRYVAHLAPDLSGSIAYAGMSSVPGHNKYDLNYSIKSLKPTFVQGFTWGTQDLSEWAETHYVAVEYNDVRLFLLKDSPSVLWEMIIIP